MTKQDRAEQTKERNHATLSERYMSSMHMSHHVSKPTPDDGSHQPINTTGNVRTSFYTNPIQGALKLEGCETLARNVDLWDRHHEMPL